MAFGSHEMDSLRRTTPSGRLARRQRMLKRKRGFGSSHCQRRTVGGQCCSTRRLIARRALDPWGVETPSIKRLLRNRNKSRWPARSGIYGRTCMAVLALPATKAGNAAEGSKDVAGVWGCEDGGEGSQDEAGRRWQQREGCRCGHGREASVVVVATTTKYLWRVRSGCGDGRWLVGGDVEGIIAHVACGEWNGVRASPSSSFTESRPRRIMSHPRRP